MGVKASMSDSFLTDYLQTRQRVDQLERIETGGGGGAASVYLTLTRTNTLSLSTAGTIVTWESEVRGNGITWSGSQITMPDDGYYVIDMAFDLNSGAVVAGNMLIGGTDVGRMALYYGGGTRNRLIATRWFSASSVLEIQINIAAGRTMQVTAYGSSYESPFLHIVKVA